MATDLKSLRNGLWIDTGKQLTEEDLDTLLLHGLDLYNAEAPQIFTVSGTVLDRDATADEKRCLQLYSLLAYLIQKAATAAESAFSVSNVAGRTDLTGVAVAIEKRIERVEKDIAKLMKRLTGYAVASEVKAEELGFSLDVVLDEDE